MKGEAAGTCRQELAAPDYPHCTADPTLAGPPSHPSSRLPCGDGSLHSVPNTPPSLAGGGTG